MSVANRFTIIRYTPVYENRFYLDKDNICFSEAKFELKNVSRSFLSKLKLKNILRCLGVFFEINVT